jgi:hypothetical protein
VLGGIAATCCAGLSTLPGDRSLAALISFIGFASAIGTAMFHLVRDGHSERLRALIPLLVTISLALAAPAARTPIARWWFRTFRIHRYASAVDWVRSQRLPVVDHSEDSKGFQLPPDLNALAYVTEAHQHTDGTVVVLFAYAGGFPVRHIAYMYTSSGHWDEHFGARWSGWRIDANWFSVGD